MDFLILCGFTMKMDVGMGYVFFFKLFIEGYQQWIFIYFIIKDHLKRVLNIFFFTVFDIFDHIYIFFEKFYMKFEKPCVTILGQPSMTLIFDGIRNVCLYRMCSVIRTYTYI